MFDFSSTFRSVFCVGHEGPGGIVLSGTAFALNKHGLFATAAHVVGNDDHGLVLAVRGHASIDDYQDASDLSVRRWKARLMAVDPFRDLAILQAPIRPGVFVAMGGASDAPVGTEIVSFGFPHADHGRLILTQQNSEIGARILIAAGGIKSKHLVLNTQARPGQSGSPLFRKMDGKLVGVLVGSYAPGGGGGISLGGVDPHTLHQTTHAISAEYISEMT